MNIQAAITETLQLLCNAYLSDEGSMVDIGEIAQKHSLDVYEFAQILEEWGYIKDVRRMPTTVHCEITLSGVQKVKPDYVPDLESKVISTLGLMGGQQNIFEILDMEPKDNQRVRDLIAYLEDQRILKDTMYYSMSEIGVKLGIRGLEIYNNGNSTSM